MSCWVRSWSNGTCVGRPPLSATFEFCFFFAVTPKVLGPIRGQPKSKSGSKAADRACPELVEGSVHPTRATRYFDGHFGHLYVVSPTTYHKGWACVARGRPTESRHEVQARSYYQRFDIACVVARHISGSEKACARSPAAGFRGHHG